MTVVDPEPPSDLAAPSFRQAGAAALFSRGVIIAAGVATSLLLPLTLDQTAVGQFFLAQLVIAALATFGQFGLTFAIPANVTDALAKNDPGRARQLILGIMAICLAASTLGAAFALWIVPELAGALDGAHKSTWLMIAPILAAIVPLTSLTAILVEVLRSTHAVKAAANLAALGSIFTAAYLGILFLAGVETSLPAVLTAGLIGWFVSVATGLVLAGRRVWRWSARANEAPAFRGLVRHTMPNLFTTLTLFGLAHVDLFLLSGLGAMSDVARYGIALRFSALIVVPLAIANAAFAPLAVHARSRGDIELLRGMLSKLVLISAGLAALLYAGFALVGYFFIPIWSSDYQSAYSLTLMLGLGNVLHACGGAAGILLMIWGDQRCALKITLCTGLLTIALCFAGLTYGGVYGLALAAAAGNALQVGVFVLRVRRLFGLDPSLAALLQRAGRRRPAT